MFHRKPDRGSAKAAVTGRLQQMQVDFMIRARELLLAGLACAIPLAALAQPANNGVVAGYPNPNTPPNLVAPNTAPGGITLVPGTVVIPAVGGTVVTGTVPLAGTVGSTGVGTLDPGLGSNPLAATRGTLYPQASYPQIALPSTNQSTVPQPVPAVPGTIIGPADLLTVLPYGAEPTVTNCPSAAPGTGAC
ncbi:MAG TPA: hypothetical protein VNH44_04810 [Micropepsaceae bacterium]|nr:hypothetical protein [Micropepsaceae bacterium]